MRSNFCLLSLWGFKRENLPERFSRQLHVRSCEICFEDISRLCSSVPIVNFEQVNADWVNIRSWLENCWKIRLEEFIFSKIGRFTWKIAVLKINSFLVAPEIIICNIIMSLEEFCTVSREILVVDYCNSENWAHCVNYCFAGWIFHRRFWVFICQFKKRDYPLAWNISMKTRIFVLSRLQCFQFFIVFFLFCVFFGTKEDWFKNLLVSILFWRCSY